MTAHLHLPLDAVPLEETLRPSTAGPRAEARTEPPALTLERVCKRYRETTALDDVSFAVRPGELVALVGPSGAGKSTVFRCLTRLVTADSGHVAVLGTRVDALRGRALREVRRRIGLIFQQFNLIGRLSALDNVLAGRLGHVATWRVATRLFPDEDRQIALAALDRVGLLDKAYQRADSLSGGQQQRVAIARVLAQQSRVVLADEPVSSLDPSSAANVIGVLRDIAREHRIGVLCALHQVDFARDCADRIVALRAGRLVLDTPARDFDAAAFTRVYGAA
ncbi:phosphonate ABC transporter ATP-binding protein [Rhodoplanes sp. TEM]|uniref:Phosphonate ABC transporter ATP-binding protein n=1 Tax=Rhodoplanes tepidamans TaxID=200616 RepID=A0ABT5JF61_RHOTP|nr:MULTISPECIES: phosphonate ABC transporter ATP-binding protein [Rhodoplanes]MDC7788340.1 phosphonate ABC transporter ATP-binding protein [Rhodoplanes tepidamans]MDC7986082.1 phosphonate ABC transporter ATP-binding protein [Rhodoplanes sp. TEM]MDQ0358821.1 phosphonate transport system ATP-binding protein [Rhodoplanes tepidamans]